MNATMKKIAEKSPFRMWIYHADGTSNTMPIAQKKGDPNLQWALKTINNYRINTIAYVVFQKNRQTFAMYKDGVYTRQ